jgi:hypothetical protein
MTAVEKIIEEINNELQTLESLHGKEIFGRKVGLAFAKRVAEQAKEMEKEQKIALLKLLVYSVCIGDDVEDVEEWLKEHELNKSE